MADEIDPERVRIIADAAGIPLGDEAQKRVARAVTPSATRFAAEKLTIPLEVEPSTFIVVQQRELKR